MFSLPEIDNDEPVVVELRLEEPWTKTLMDNALMGSTFPQLVRILWSNRAEIDYTIFGARLAFLFLISILSSMFALFDTLLFSRAIARTPLAERPIIIIGHPRSGTTLLQNLLALDDQFVTPNTFQAGWASSFLTMERFASFWPLSSVLSPTRPMDALALSWSTPCEDEVATNVLCGGVSPYMATHFLRNWEKYLPYVSFLEPASREAFPRWRKAFLYFCRKLCYLCPGRRLLLKSPCHTGRIWLLNALFKNTAQFIVVHRDPHEIFQSSHAALVDKYIRPCAALQTFTNADAQSYILGQGRILQAAFMADEATLPPGRLIRVAFSDLVNNQMGTMENVYEQLGMSSEAFERVRGKFAKHACLTREFQQNKFPAPTMEARGVVERQWADMFREFGYKKTVSMKKAK